jgi:hypothetical protein
MLFHFGGCGGGVGCVGVVGVGGGGGGWWWWWRVVVVCNSYTSIMRFDVMDSY